MSKSQFVHCWSFLFFITSFLRAAAFDAGADSLAEATPIDRLGVSVSTDMSSYGAEPLDPELLNSPRAGASAWWKWTAPETGFYVAYAKPVKGGPDKGVVAVFEGHSPTDLKLHSRNYIDTGDSPAYGSMARVTFWAAKGTPYHILLDRHEDDPVLNGKMVLGLNKMKTHTRTMLLNGGDPLFGAGSCSVRMLASGRFTGRIALNGRTYPLAGSLNEAGEFSKLLVHKPWRNEEALPEFRFTLDVSNEWSASVDSQYFGSGGTLLEETVFGKYNPHHSEGRYTMHLTGEGTGSVLMGINKSGVVKGVAILPDGQKISFSTSCYLDASANMTVLYMSVYVPRHVRGGMLFGGSLVPSWGKSFDGGLSYIRKDLTSSEFSCYGGIYTPPRKPSKTEALDGSLTHMGFLPNSNPDLAGFLVGGTLSVDGLGFSNAAQVSYNLAGQLKIFSTEKRATLKLVPATGLVTGSVEETFDLPGGREGRRRRTLVGCLAAYGNVAELKGHVLPLKGVDEGWSPGDFSVRQRLR